MDNKSIHDQEMAWCHQAPSHYLNQCWQNPRHLIGIPRPQRVNEHQCVQHHKFYISANISMSLCKASAMEKTQSCNKPLIWANKRKKYTTYDLPNCRYSYTVRLPSISNQKPIKSRIASRPTLKNKLRLNKILWQLLWSITWNECSLHGPITI